MFTFYVQGLRVDEQIKKIEVISSILLVVHLTNRKGVMGNLKTTNLKVLLAYPNHKCDALQRKVIVIEKLEIWS